MERAGSQKDDDIVIREVMDSVLSAVSTSLEVEDGRKSRGASEVSSEVGEGTTVPGGSSVSGDALNPHYTFPNVQQKDAYLVFRALCLLAHKDDGDNDPKSTYLRSKVLALEMILNVLQNSSTIFQNAPPFILLIRKSLCVTLSKNAVNPNIDVFEKSLAIFVELFDKFKVHLKLQIEVFFKEIILMILESPSSSYEHKWLVLNTIQKILANPQGVVDIYVNYDCDMTSANIYEQLVNALSKVANGPNSDVNATVQVKERDRAMRLLGLHCMVEMLQCLVEWFEEGEARQKEAARQAEEEEKASVEAVSPTLDHFSTQKQKKEVMEQGILLFTRKPKEGLRFLQEKGFVGSEPVEIAEFLLKEERLDKTVVGDYLGDGDDFNKSVMYAYVDDFDFCDVEFVEALRKFLHTFRLPGEAQKIDRLMEKFASRYCECNPTQGIFASADTAYVLAYSIIMLTTDLHNSQIRTRMTKEDYIKMNKGINNGADLPSELLLSIYDSIAREELKMKAGASKLLKSRADLTGTSNERQRKALQSLELEAMSQTAKSLMESAWQSDARFTSASHHEHVKPMFRICWTPCLACFSQGLQTSDDEEVWSPCLIGFRYGIRVACFFMMDLERNAYIQALARFTLLTAKSSLTEMKRKNLESIKLMLMVGIENGNYLEKNWYEVLRCVSQLELAQLIGTGMSKDGGADGTPRNYINNSVQFDDKTLASLQGQLGETNSQAVVVAVDKIFQNSSSLTGDAVVAFVLALCQVSREELSIPGSPRMYMLQRTAEVSFYNMNRIRLQWTRIWSVLGEYFNQVGCNADLTVAHFSVDSLKQLSMKFLEKGELPNFRFQKDFLRPFEVIMSRNANTQIREIVVACCTQMVDKHWTRIKSGWKNILSVYTLAASETTPSVVEAAFQSTSFIVDTVAQRDLLVLLDSFQELLKCLAEFACNSNLPDLNMEAIRLVRSCASVVASNGNKIVEAPWEEAFQVTGNQRVSLFPRDKGFQQIWLRGWFPIFFELFSIINRCKLDVRTRSLTVLFEIMKQHGAEFSDEWWRDLFKIVFRIFDGIRRDEPSRGDRREWMTTTCNHALFSIVDVLTEFYEPLADLLLPSILEQLTACMQQQHEQLARSAVNCLESLIFSNGKRFDEAKWKMVVDHLTQTFTESLPKLLLTWQPEAYLSNNRQDVVELRERNGEIEDSVPLQGDAQFSDLLVRCVVQSELVDAVLTMVVGATRQEDVGEEKRNHSSLSQEPNDSASHCVYSYMSPELLLRVCASLEESAHLARSFNRNNAQRTLLWKAGLKGTTKPNMLKQETNAQRTLLAILLRLVADERGGALHPTILERTKSAIDDSLTYYASLDTEQYRVAYVPVLRRLLREASRLPERVLDEFGDDFPLRLCSLVGTEDDHTVRGLLANILAATIKRRKPVYSYSSTHLTVNGSS